LNGFFKTAIGAVAAEAHFVPRCGYSLLKIAAQCSNRSNAKAAARHPTRRMMAI
jgi:hypothetical protein